MISLFWLVAATASHSAAAFLCIPFLWMNGQADHELGSLCTFDHLLLCKLPKKVSKNKLRVCNMNKLVCLLKGWPRLQIIKAASDWPAVGVTIWRCQWHSESTVQALVGCAGLAYVSCNINSIITCDLFAVLAVLWLLGYQSVCLLTGMVYRVAAGIGSQERFKALLAQTIHKTSPSTHGTNVRSLFLN